MHNGHKGHVGPENSPDECPYCLREALKYERVENKRLLEQVGAGLTEHSRQAMNDVIGQQQAQIRRLKGVLRHRPAGYPEWDEEKLREEAEGEGYPDRRLARWELAVREELEQPT